MNKHSACPLTVALLSLFATQFAAAAELRLRAQCNPAGPVVTLGDVAEIDSSDGRQAAALAAIELFPAPSTATRSTECPERTVKVREIQDLLLLRGQNLTELRFSGSSEVTVQTVAARPQAPASKPVSAGETQRINRRICDALIKYLSEHVTAPQTWSVEFALTDAQARARQPAASGAYRRRLRPLDRFAKVRSRRRGTQGAGPCDDRGQRPHHCPRGRGPARPGTRCSDP